MRLGKPIEPVESETPSPRRAMDGLLRHGWMLVLLAALLLASYPQASQYRLPGSATLTASRTVSVGIVPQAVFYDRAPAAVALHAWKSRQFDFRERGTLDGPALAAAHVSLAIPAGRPGAVRSEFADAPRRIAFRHFDAQGPPSSA